MWILLGKVLSEQWKKKMILLNKQIKEGSVYMTKIQNPNKVSSFSLSIFFSREGSIWGVTHTSYVILTMIVFETSDFRRRNN